MFWTAKTDQTARMRWLIRVFAKCSCSLVVNVVPRLIVLFNPVGGIYIKCDLVPSRTEEDVYECTYVPPKVGQYLVNITFGGLFIAKSPFCVDVGPAKTSNIVAFGPGLKGGIVNQPARFIVETNGEPGVVGKSIETAT